MQSRMIRSEYLLLRRRERQVAERKKERERKGGGRFRRVRKYGLDWTISIFAFRHMQEMQFQTIYEIIFRETTRNRRIVRE